MKEITCRNCKGLGRYPLTNFIPCRDCSGTGTLRVLEPGEVAVKEEVIHDIGRWLSAALEDEGVCAEMKKDINNFFRSLEPTPSKEAGDV